MNVRIMPPTRYKPVSYSQILNGHPQRRIPYDVFRNKRTLPDPEKFFPCSSRATMIKE